MDALVRRFIADDRGATAVEYGLIAALISIVVFAAVSAVFNATGRSFNLVNASLTNATSN